MKLLLSTLITFALIFNVEKREAEVASVNPVTHVELSEAAEFGLGNPYSLDIDKDGKTDFLFNTVSFYSNENIHTEYLIQGIGANEVLTVDGSIAISEEGNSIESSSPSSNLKWGKGNGEIITSVYNGKTTSWSGTWSGDRAQYVGVKLVKNNTPYYAWVRVSIDPVNEKAMVHEYAINRKPGSSITAGI